ncbi:zinc finger protein 567-like isoform X2 [Ambystoma mexicanum]
MNDIQQAFFSLGPLIATSIFSLRAEQKQDLLLVNNQETEKRDHGINRSPNNMMKTSDLFKKKGDGKENVEYLQGTERSKSNDCLNTETGPMAIEAVVSFRIKEEGEINSMDYQEPGRGDAINFPTGHENKNTARSLGHSLKYQEKPTHCKSMTRPNKTNVVKIFGERTQATNQKWSENNKKSRGEKTTQWQDSFSQPADPIFEQRTTYVQESRTYNEGENTAGTKNMLQSEANTLQIWNPYAGLESEQQIFQTDSHAEYQRTPTEALSYKCTECEKSFSIISELFQHEKTHTMEKPYQCSICGKSFNQKGVLGRHQIIHTGERPFHCTVCGKSFNQKEVLIRHQKIHTGERPYQCTICGRSFNQRGILLRHQTTHMPDRTALES